jgi:hypothetical protein|tara:strand:- start:540 stop:722 length:183 start_codon:yes stop_codon:yes gene_type:complete
MTRYHQFNYLYPDKANDIHQGYQDMSSSIWNAFTKITHIDKLFVFTPKEFKKDQDEVSGE